MLQKLHYCYVTLQLHCITVGTLLVQEGPEFDSSLEVSYFIWTGLGGFGCANGSY